MRYLAAEKACDYSMTQATYVSQEEQVSMGLAAINDVSNFSYFHEQHARLFQQYITDDYFTISSQLQRGTATLGSNIDVLNYMLLYGGFLYQCSQAIASHLFNYNAFSLCASKSIHLVDYACGQGSVSLIAMQEIKRLMPQITALDITLIEPSAFSLARAVRLIEACAEKLGLNVNLHCYQTDFDSLPQDFLQTSGDQQMLHLFANIIDLFCFGSFKLDVLLDKIKLQKAEHKLLAISIRHPISFNSDDMLGFYALDAYAQAHRVIKNEVSYVNNVSCFELYGRTLYRVNRNKRMMIYACEFN